MITNISTMKFALLLITIVQSALSLHEWEQFKLTYNKIYENQQEENYRRHVFEEKLQLVGEHNKQYEQGFSTYKIQINKFADLNEDEIFSKVDFDHQTILNGSVSHRISSTDDIPDSIDWRDYGVISPIADQKVCETCWAFATVATIEAHWAIYKGENVTLSQQNLADCVDSTFTCRTEMRRDILELTYQYIIDNGGIDTLESYPYEDYAVGSCRFNSDNIGATITSYANVTEGDEEELKRIVGTIGPVTVAITTDINWALFYTGVYYNSDCMNADKIFNHAVVIVGYGTENGQDYWLVKNSWGTWFGEHGYIKMARNRDNNCGIASIARYPIV